MKLPVVALRDMTVLPGMLMHFDVSREKSISAAEYAMNEDRQIFLTCQKDENTEDPEEDDLFRTGTVGTVQQIMKLPDGIIRVLVKGKERAILKKLTALEPCLMGEVELMPCCRDVVEEEQEAMIRTLKDGIREYAQLNRAFGEGAVKSLLTYQTLEGLIMELMIRLPMSNDQRQALLEQDSTCGRFYMLSGFMQTEGEILQLRREIQDRVKERVDQNQKEYVLREQMKVIHEELGDDDASDIRHYEEALDKLKAGQEVKDKIRKEIHRLSAMPNGSQEGTVSRTYIETLLELPWQKAFPGKPRYQESGEDSERGSLWHGEDQGANPGISGGSSLYRRGRRLDPVPGGPARHRQDFNRPLGCPRTGQEVCARLPGRRP